MPSTEAGKVRESEGKGFSPQLMPCPPLSVSLQCILMHLRGAHLARDVSSGGSGGTSRGVGDYGVGVR